MEVHHVETKLRDVTCHNNTSVVIQLLCVLLLVLANGIQAFRARKLPSHFKVCHFLYSQVNFYRCESVAWLLSISLTTRTLRNPGFTLILQIEVLSSFNGMTLKFKLKPVYHFIGLFAYTAKNTQLH